MDGIKHSGRFAEMERLVNDYFNCHIAPIMSKTRADLIRNQGEEMKEYSTSLGGILSMMASSAQPMSDPYQALKVTGELYRDVQDGDYRFRGNAARPCVYGRAVAGYRRARNRKGTLQ